MFPECALNDGECSLSGDDCSLNVVKCPLSDELAQAALLEAMDTAELLQEQLRVEKVRTNHRPLGGLFCSVPPITAPSAGIYCSFHQSQHIVTVGCIGQIRAHLASIGHTMGLSCTNLGTHGLIRTPSCT
jgi:hypothetical protein